MKWFSQRFPDYEKLSTSGKILAWIILLQGLYPLFIMGTVLFHNISTPLITIIILITISGLHLFAAWKIFHYQISGFRWAILLFIQSLIQFRAVFYDSGFSFEWNSAGLLKLSIGFGNFNGGYLNFNIAALIFLILAYKNITKMKADIHAHNPDIPENQI